MLISVIEILKGGPGSGFHGHSGRPGERGGSSQGPGGDKETFNRDVKTISEEMGLPESVVQTLLRLNKIGVASVGAKLNSVSPSDTEKQFTEPGKKFTGKCYDKAAQYISYNDTIGSILVHGTLTDGKVTIGHAWVELPSGKVFDGTQQQFYPKDDFYKAFNAVEERTYTKEQVYKNMLKYRHYGPWHKTAGLVRGLKGKKEE